MNHVVGDLNQPLAARAWGVVDLHQLQIFGGDERVDACLAAGFSAQERGVGRKLKSMVAGDLGRFAR
jgi:hypothetical protein